MTKNFKYIFCGLFVVAMTTPYAFATTANTSRVATTEHARAAGVAGGASGTRAKQSATTQRGTSRTARTVAKRASVTPNRAATTVNSISRAGNVISNAGNAIIRRAFGISRSATPTSVARAATGAHTARSAVQPGGASRARATAVFGDISKLGDGYNQCREAYNTCMDQFCAGANETYRRCYCSNTFRDFRDKEDALDAATTLLAQFENNNLNAVTLSAEEVNAMYTATAGEAAIKNDTSGAAALLSDIGDLLSGKKKASDTRNTLTSLSGLSVDFSTDLGDIWGGGSATSLFNDSSVADLSTMEGVELYNNAHNQCMQLVGTTCDAGAVRNMAKSAYSILITQDCNAYQKKIDAKAEQVKSTVRTAEKYLREARLEEYRSHNSADVNECLDKVEAALTQPTACGTDYVKCLDYSGVYINTTSGEPIYSPRLFELNGIITLDGSSDVLTQNPQFNQFLDSKRVYAKTALESCRDLADTVWTEFKRNALIKISQAQDEKIEEVKMSCVSTMKDCYDTQSGALKSFDDTTAQASGALAARASTAMCMDKVAACAALYASNSSDYEQCKFDKDGRITNLDKCGLKALRNFVDTVDDVRVAEGCGTAVENYLKQICTPSTGDEGYPWNCRLREFGNLNGNHSWADSTQNSGKDLVSLVVNYAIDNCGVGSDGVLETRSQNEIIGQLETLREELGDLIGEKCEAADGIWVDADDTDSTGLSDGTVIDSFYSVNFGKSYNKANTDYSVDSWGKCIQNSVKARCDAENKRTGNNGYATYDASTGQCNLTIEYYKYQCEQALGIWADDNNCYIEK